MGIRNLFGFSQARDKPKNLDLNSGYSFLFGGTTSGKPVNERTALQTTAVYACVRILAEAVASLPLHVYEYKNGGKELVYNHALYKILHDCIFREICASVPKERSAIPLETERSSAD